jgi:two-component system, NarL family, response regulator YdfI
MRKSGQKKQPAAQGRATAAPNTPRLRVLVASPLPLTAAGLESKLRAHELEVTTSSAQLAHLPNTLRQTNVDVLIFDAEEYSRENNHSLDLLSTLAAAMPIVVLIATATPQWLAQAHQAGIKGVLASGASGRELAAAVRAVAYGLTVFAAEFPDMIFPRPAHPEADEFEFSVESLTAREQQVLATMAEGLLNKEIADRLHISEHTVKFHVSSIMGKLGASSRTEAVTMGIRRGILFV